MIRRLGGPALAATVVALVAGCGTPSLAGPQSARRIDPAASPAPGASASGAQGGGSGTCRWKAVEPGNETNVKNVGTPPTSVPKATTAVMALTTNLGAIEITMDAKAAQCAVASFSFLAGKKFFDGTSCHRLVTEGIHVLQCGDPSGTGAGGPSYQYAEENLPKAKGYASGTVAVARTAVPGTSGSQFFVNFGDNPELTADYTLLGVVTRGMDVVDQVARGGVGAGGQSETDGPPKVSLVLQRVTVAYG
ncbi:peptidylprolyl isomerase [Dactylosporangium sp. AC04546]|uniref:peptidylprolyl isomerase n=1 Tax=Dactylosporangium sp. AC04546 TaxID=2862460 RepID=UPI001EDCF3C9|nr:peptidylprolyl isomerase [Dactylosporangium sp. AC04546]WVK87384.1 peptidylprolyl isomerase [Dactylosporangium sp. AC04546]